jgi:hypothetical protein
MKGVFFIDLAKTTGKVETVQKEIQNDGADGTLS